MFVRYGFVVKLLIRLHLSSSLECWLFGGMVVDYLVHYRLLSDVSVNGVEVGVNVIVDVNILVQAAQPKL